jgi:SAM-dependent methyltransferase
LDSSRASLDWSEHSRKLCSTAGEFSASPARAQIEEQRASNRSTVPYYASFASHRERLTELAVGRAPGDARGRLCVLGAGNCFDLDLERLCHAYAEVHLVDLDEQALAYAVERQPESVRSRLFAHAPIDLTGMLDRLERWAAMRVTERELIVHPDETSRAVERQTAAPFDVVVSACVLTQLHRAPLNTLTDRHRLYFAVRQIVTLTHLRTLLRLLTPGGRALLVTDVCSSEIDPLSGAEPGVDLRALMQQLLAAGRAIGVADPVALSAMVREDPTLGRHGELSGPLDAWLWQASPERRFLVYASELVRKTERG